MSINELFNTNTSEVVTSTRGLQGTAELTRLASGIADGILKAMEADIDAYKPRIQKSTENSKEMDDIIDELGSIDADETAFLQELDEVTIDNMLRSQQSKRSRTKGKAMTLDNYRTLLTAAIAESIIRNFLGKPKNYTASSRHFGSVDYTGAQLEELAADQDRLRREIRNVQSKKSIMKSKEGFDEADERWLQLLKAEQQLKDLRVTNERVVEVDHTKSALADMLDGIEIEKLKSADAHELLAKIAEMTQQ